MRFHEFAGVERKCVAEADTALFTSPRPNSGLPEFGTISWPKSDISDLGRGEVTPTASSRELFTRHQINRAHAIHMMESVL